MNPRIVFALALLLGVSVGLTLAIPLAIQPLVEENKELQSKVIDLTEEKISSKIKLVGVVVDGKMYIQSDSISYSAFHGNGTIYIGAEDVSNCLFEKGVKVVIFYRYNTKLAFNVFQDDVKFIAVGGADWMISSTNIFQRSYTWEVSP